MIDADTITRNENTNDGALIYLYYNRSIGAWTAYGPSAYGLRLFGKTYNQDNPRGFSDELQMPCTIADSHTLSKLFSQCAGNSSRNCGDAQTLCFRTGHCVDTDAYNLWASKLRNTQTTETQLDMGGDKSGRTAARSGRNST